MGKTGNGLYASKLEIWIRHTRPLFAKLVTFIHPVYNYDSTLYKLCGSVVISVGGNFVESC